uniref:SAM and HD domain containing deoxynucleoside triphosphate triphosphohydrolase 1 n=1 Tax=Oryzias melastigma TaxID=30732 RepID=A0A3B3C9A9_ORYME
MFEYTNVQMRWAVFKLMGVAKNVVFNLNPSPFLHWSSLISYISICTSSWSKSLNKLNTINVFHSQVFNDSVHGHVELHPFLVKIIDTPQFQRLRNIKQLGGGYLVYPGASHNRFEHSIGVAHLAGVKAKLRKSAYRIKGLSFTVTSPINGFISPYSGHGPFSHLFDQMFIPQACPTEEWKHEDNSVKMFEYLIEKNGLTEDIEKLGEKALIFIKELILGEPLQKTSKDSAAWQYDGRKEDKSFLYEIVSNKENGIDVDKFDYFARDCHHLGIKNNFDHLRYFMFTRVIESKRKHICSRDKEAENLYNMFNLRNFLHRRVYQHKVKTNVEIMIKDALLKANNLIKIEGKGQKMVTLSAAKDDTEAYTELTDQVLERILVSTSTDKKMEAARKILHRITTRDFYNLIGEAKPVTYSYGKGDKNPMENAYFYKKNEPDQAFIIPKLQVSKFLPECFLEQTIRLYWKNEDKTHLKDVTEAFKAWCERNEFEVIFRSAMLDFRSIFSPTQLRQQQRQEGRGTAELLITSNFELFYLHFFIIT